MSKYSERVNEILKNANSKKVMDTKKCVTELLELYENPDAIDEIDENTQKNIQGVVNWSCLIHIAHKLLLSETDRLVNKDNNSKTVVVQKQNIRKLVQKTFQCATSKTQLLKCTDIMPLIFQILGTNLYKYYHDTYMNILVSYVLPFRTYRIEMLSENWEELWKICLHLYKNTSSPASKQVILNALQMIVNYGRLYSSLSLDVKKILIFLEHMVLDVKTNQDNLTECSFKFANTVCRQIATEYRATLCRFGENILPSVISFKSSVEKYKLLLFVVEIHHPKGTSKTCDGAYADDWNKWYTILEHVQQMVLKEFKADVLPRSFIYLAREVFKQIFESSSIFKREAFDESDDTQPVKRRRINNVNEPVDMLIGCNPEEAWPMIQVLIALFERYPECLKSQNLPMFVKSIVDLLAQPSKEKAIADDLYELAAILLINEKVFSTEDIENSNIHWDKIWDTLLRSLNVNQNETSAHKLVQLFITNNKITNPNALLKLYFTNAIKWSVMSLRTLIVLCEYLPLPNDIAACNINVCSPTMSSNSVRSCLITWALNVPWHKMATRIAIDELCLFLIDITLKSKPEKRTRFDEYDACNSCDCLKAEEKIESLDERIEDCYLSLTYKTNLFADTEEKNVRRDVQMNEQALYMEDVLTYLTNSLSDVMQESRGNDDLHVIIIKIAILAKLVSMMKRLNMIPRNNEEVSLVCTMKRHLDIAYALLENIDASKNKYTYLYNVTKALGILYGTLYDTDVAKIIVSSATSNMLINVFGLMNSKDNEINDYKASNDRYDYDFFQGRRQSLSSEVERKKQCDYCDKGTIRLQAMKALSLFCCMNVGGKKYEIQVKLMSNFLNISMYDLSGTVDFKMAITVLEYLFNYNKEELWDNFKELPLKNVSKLYEKYWKDETAVRYILNNLPYFLEYAANYDCELDNLMNIVLRFNQFRSEKKYGFLAHIEFMRSLSKIIRKNSSLFHYEINDGSSRMPIMESVSSALNDSLFVVRLQAIDCIREVYSSKNIDLKWKEELFVRIEESANELRIDNKKDNKTEVDEKETKIASILLTLTAIIRANGIFQCRALLTMLRFIVDNGIDIEIILKAMSTIENRINYSNFIEDNLSYLMTYWFDSKYSSEPFPWKLTECKSVEQFHKMYGDTLAFVKFQNLELSKVISFCTDAHVPFERIIENIFPKVLSWLLYCMNEKNEDTMKRLANKVFYAMISNQNEFAGMTKFSTLFNQKFEEILVYLVERLHDEDYLEESLEVKVSFAISDPPHFTKADIDACLRYIEKNFFTESVSIQYVLVQNFPNVLQKILLHLIGNVSNKKFVEHKMKAFHQYIFFCTLIAEELKSDYFDVLSMYVIKDISCSLLHTIKEHDDDILLESACKYFNKFIRLALPARIEEIKEILNFTATVLVPIAETGKVPITLEILDFLLIKHKEVLGDAINKLNSFPDTPVFREIRDVCNDLKCKTEKTRSLEEEIRHFLNTVLDKDINCNVEDVARLRTQLSMRKEELRGLYRKFEKFRGFTEDCASSILHRSIYKLIKLTASSDVEVSMEAAKCLGELGPADLTSMILYLQKSHVKESSDLQEIVSYKIVIAMTKCLFQSDVKFRKVSANALYTVFSSSWGQKLLDAKYMEQLKAILGEPQMTLPERYIQPFIINRSAKISSVDINHTTCNDIVNSNNDIWSIRSNDSYSNWIAEATRRIMECFTGFYFENLRPVCTLSSDFCEIILPRIIFLIIHTDRTFISAVCSCINRFFDYHFNVTTKMDVSSYATQKVTNCDHRIVRSMLNIVNYIRIQVADNLLNLNYICIAKAAQYCSAFFTAILYAEMFCESVLNDRNDFVNVSKIDYVYELLPEEGKVIQNILRDTYTKIGDFDAISGTGSSHLQDHSTRTQHYVYTNEWNQVMLTQDVELSFGNVTAMREMANGLYQSGLQYLLGHFMSTASREDEDTIFKDLRYECAWRLCDWNFRESNRAVNTENNCDFRPEITEYEYHFYHYQALKYLHRSDENGVRNAIRNARSSIVKALRNTSLESSKTVYEKLTQLQLISEIEELSVTKEDEYEQVLRKWQQQDIANFNEFRYIEPILFQRTVMYQINTSLADNVQIKTALADTYLQISEIAADKGNLHIASRSLAMLAKQKDLPPKIQDQSLYQESLLARLRNDLELGRFLLRNLMHKETLDIDLRARVLRVYGDWMAEMKSENPQAVIEKYYIPSIDSSNSIREQTADTVRNLHDTYVALARFADSQFEQISLYMKSPQFESLKECIMYSYKGIDKRTLSEDKDVRCALILNHRQNTNDVAELERIEKEKNKYLVLALKYYLTTLQQSEDHNLLVFRIIALWLDNTDQKEINDLLNTNLNAIPSFKFVPLLPQLAVHLSNDSNEFSKKIRNIVERCSLQHPHHTLPVLLALKNLYGDYNYNTASKKSKVIEPRVLGARKLLQDLTQTNISLIIREMENLSHSLVMLANLPTSSNKSGCTIRIPKDQKILKVQYFENVFVPTVTINVKPSGNYNNVIGITKYVETYETVGGVNTPKKLTCIGMDGIVRHQLIKGRDDLRQDAVMQQVFNVMNTLLRACKETKRRKLTIRTYKVVPLTQRSGILEWCDNTMPIITVLIGSKSMPGLHKKYYPNDYTADMCKEKLATKGQSSTDVKLKTFMDCCAHMHPALHYFFVEKFPSPETWFERRLAYTRSIATTSMAGYILGLGDRHLNNILIDQTTAEVIHIDFGIAFEQGKVLPVPETVPFRLTRNIEVGMGVSGVEGTMRHCCEKTLTVLRDQRQIIITLLQVLLYDPLFKWTITPAKAHGIQNRTSSTLIETNQYSSGINKPAERSLLRIEQKLQGTEEGLASSVSGQVERLIQQARDPINLCRLYFGWQPYL